MKVLHIDVDGNVIALLENGDKENLGYGGAEFKEGESYPIPDVMPWTTRLRNIHKSLGAALEGTP